MKVILFNPYADMADMKGAARRISFLSNLLSDAGIPHQVVLRPDYQKLSAQHWWSRLARFGLNRLSYFLYVRELCRDVNCIVVSEVIFAPTWRRNFILTIHDLKTYHHKATRGGRGRRVAYFTFSRLAHRIIVVSRAVKEDIVAQCGVQPRRVFVVRNGIAAKRIELLRNLLGAREPITYDFIYVSSFAKHKRHEQVIEAAPPGARICFIGRDLGSLDMVMETIQQRHDITVHVLDNINDDATLFRHIRTSRCGVFPSVFEGFGIPLLEYSACGLHVIASDIAPFLELREYVDEFVPADDVVALGAAMARVFATSFVPDPVSGLDKIERGAHTEAAIFSALAQALSPVAGDVS